MLLAAIVFFVQTKDGVIRVEINGPDIEVSIKGTEIVLKRAYCGKDIKLSPGDHTLIIQRGDFKFETDKLILKRAETVTVRVELLAGKIQVRQGEKLIGQKKLPTRDSSSVPALAIAPFDTATAKKHQQAWAKHLGAQIETTNSIGMKMVLIPPGQFTMGSPQAEIDPPNIRELQTIGVQYQPSVWHDSLTSRDCKRLSHTAKRLEAAGFLQRITEPQRDRVKHIRPTSMALRWVIEAAKGSVNRPALLEGVKRCHWAAGFCRQFCSRARQPRKNAAQGKQR